MKSIRLLGSLIASFTLSVNSYAADIVMEPAPVSKIFVPHGFDTNDHIEVVLHGYLPNGCYKPGDIDVNVDHGAPGEKGRVEISAFVARHMQDYCIEILIEYKEVVKVGYLEAKEYEIYLTEQDINPSDGLKVSFSQTSGPDDHVYLPVDSVAVEASETGQELILRGAYPAQKDKCLSPDRYEIYRAPDSVLIVLPIAQVTSCDGQAPQGFEYRVPLSEDMKISKGMMVHVRSLNGHSVNKVYDWALFSGF